MHITKDFVLDTALELCRKVYEDSLFEENFHIAAKELESLLVKKPPKILITNEVSYVKFDEKTKEMEMNIEFDENIEDIKESIYHETSHLLFTIYSSITGDKYLKETNHPAVKDAHRFIRECSERAKSKFTWKYFIVPFLKFFDFILRENDMIYPVDMDKIEMCDEKTQQKALNWLEEVAVNKLTSYYCKLFNKEYGQE